MPSELQRVAQGLVDVLDELPRIAAYLQRTAQQCRNNAALVATSNNPAARMAAMQLNEAARRCDEAARYASLAPPRARTWAEQMVSGGRTAVATGRSGEVGGGGSDPHNLSTPRISEEEGRRLQGQLPIREDTLGRRDKTRGIWVDREGIEQDLVSGETDLFEEVKQFLKDRKLGPERGELMTPTHVETKFAMFMRLRGLDHETIMVNQVPCKGKWGCEELIGRILPAGSTLTVFGPDGFTETYPKPPTKGTEAV